jgi:hypothetical protein
MTTITRGRILPILAGFLGLILAGPVLAQGCPAEPTLQNFSGAGSVACPCFASGEEAGATFQIPAEHFPIEILRVGVGWGSLFGGFGVQIEQAIHIYNGQYPDPGTPIYTLVGPQMYDGVINEFNLEPIAGEIIAPAGAVSVTLEFQTANAGNSFAPTTVHDGAGCQPGRNLIKAIPGGWLDACQAGITGNWVFHLVYRQVNCLSDVGDEFTLASVPATAKLHPCFPNPFNPSTVIRYDLPQDGNVRLAVYSLDGRRVATLEDGLVGAGTHEAVWQGRDDQGLKVPSGVYFYRLETPGYRETLQMVLLK